ncbi:hypothetical protein GCM10023208_23650 [Erythrobacter westpacificensis]|uniref:DNA-binding protein n=1 Tax=Erythrobacter westpacificensis TaxID=1055231 RepID=A0ABP9KIC6_9SPHN
MPLQKQLTSAELDDMLGAHAGYCAKLRLTGDGPRYSKLGRKVLYDPRDVQAWLNERKVQSTSEAA